MIVPIGHEETMLRRVPWVTFGIMILCTLSLVATQWIRPAPVVGETSPQSELRRFVIAHPYLEVDPEAQRRLFDDGRGGDQDGAGDVRETRRRYSDLRRELIGVERAALLSLRNDGQLRPDVHRLARVGSPQVRRTHLQLRGSAAHTVERARECQRVSHS